MPRKTKDVENEIKLTTKVSKQSATTKSNSDVKKTSTSKKGATKRTGVESASTKSAKKSTSSKKSSLKTVENDTVVASKKEPRTTKKASTKSKTKTVKNDVLVVPKKKKTVSKKKNATAKTPKAREASKEDVLEYYDLPYRYNETVVKILAQTPKRLFIYWDISDDDRNNFVNKFGNDFFNNTVPVLIVHNDSMNYTFEVEINDFANCWYLDINDTKCNYTIELGRRSKIKSYYIPNNYIYVTSSNKIESPNDHILFEKQTRTVYFRNVKNNSTHTKDIANLSFIKNMGKIYSIYDAYQKLYSKIYGDEDFINGFDMNNPSSGNPTSTFK